MRGLLHNAISEAQISLQSKIITPYADGQIILPDENYDALDQVTVNTIPIRTVGSPDIIYGNPYGNTVLIGTPTYTISSIIDGEKTSPSAVVIVIMVIVYSISVTIIIRHYLILRPIILILTLIIYMGIMQCQ